MLERCPGAKLVGRTYLENRVLEFYHYANIRYENGEKTPAVVWEISLADEGMLDRCEGFPKHYSKENIIVQVDGVKVCTMAYVMIDWKKEKDLRAKQQPCQEYLNIIKRGNLEHGFKSDIGEIGE